MQLVARSTDKHLGAHISRPRDHFTAIPNRYFDDSSHGLAPRDKTTYQALYRLSWGFGQDSCWVSVDRLADLVVVSRNTVRAALDSLEAKKRIEVFSRGNDGLRIRVFPLFDDELGAVLPPAEVSEGLPPGSGRTGRVGGQGGQEKPIDGGEILESGGSEIAPTKETAAKKTSEEHTVCLAPAVSAAAAPPTIPAIVAADLGGSPLQKLPQRALDTITNQFPYWLLIQTIFTLLISYASKKLEVLNPVALLRFALKNKSFHQIDVKDIMSILRERIRWIHLEHKFCSGNKFSPNEITELLLLGDYIEGQEVTLPELFEFYRDICKGLAERQFTIWRLLQTPKPKL